MSRFTGFTGFTGFSGFYKVSQIPAALCIGYITRQDFVEKKQPEFISNVSGITIGILGSFVWPGLAAVYSYSSYTDNNSNKNN